MMIQQKIRWTLLCISVLPLSIVTAIYSANFFHALQINAKDHITDLAATSATQLNIFLVSAVRDTRALAASSSGHSGNIFSMTTELTQFTFSYPYFKEALWVNLDGRVFASSNRQQAGQRIEDLHPELQAQFLQALRQPSGQMQILESKADSPDSMQLKLLLRADNSHGDAVGVLVTSVLDAPIQHALRDAQMRLPGMHSVGLLNKKGDILMVSEGSHFQEHQWFQMKIDTMKEDLTQEYAFVVEDTHGKDVVAIAPVQGIAGQEHRSWRVVVVAPWEIVTAKASESLLNTAAAIMGLALCVWLAAWLMTRRIVGRINLLVEGTKAISNGELTHQIAIADEDELGMFARAFNDMAQKIHLMAQDKAVDTKKLSALAASLELRGLELERNLTRTKLQNQQITLRNEIGELLQSCLNLDEVGSIVNNYLPQLFPASSGALYLSDDRRDSMTAISVWGVQDAQPTQRDFKREDCWGLRSGKPHFFDGADFAVLCAHAENCTHEMRMCIPMIARGQTVGLMHLAYSHGASSGEMAHGQLQSDLAVSVAALLAMAVANLRLSAALREDAILDVLTGLFNRRYFDAALPREISRAARDKAPLAVLMLDVDHFKKFNDTHGHDAGDAVLRALGQALRSNCRQADTACRFGGEEFTILLPDTNEADAREWSERLRHLLRDMEITSSGLVLPAVTVSLGLALYPIHGQDGYSLFKAADNALYIAKHAGRDRLCVAQCVP